MIQEIRDLQTRLAAVERSLQRPTQEIRDDGDLRLRWGRQPDGAYTVRAHDAAGTLLADLVTAHTAAFGPRVIGAATAITPLTVNGTWIQWPNLVPDAHMAPMPGYRRWIRWTAPLLWVPGAATGGNVRLVAGNTAGSHGASQVIVTGAATSWAYCVSPWIEAEGYFNPAANDGCFIGAMWFLGNWAGAVADVYGYGVTLEGKYLPI